MLYAITDRRRYGANEARARERLLKQTAVWATNGVAFIQLREKDLSGRDQVELARAMMGIVRKAGKQPGLPRGTRFLTNGRPDVALAAEADGVHLPAGTEALTPNEVRSIFEAAGRAQPPYISVSCHTLLEVKAAQLQATDCILFAPIFEKIINKAANPETRSAKTLPGTGLALLEQACKIAAPIPVFALGGITAENAAQCLRVGAAGVAAIRLLHAPASAWKHLVLAAGPLRATLG